MTVRPPQARPATGTEPGVFPGVLPDDTIAAIATPLGEGGIALVRISGAQALAVADRVFHPGRSAAPLPSAASSHTLHHGRIERDATVVDEVLLAVMRAPHTYTREHIVEISCHGGLLVAKIVLDTVLEKGARLALPGEFTKRAFLNGRLDLAQAEAVADLIHSRTELALAAANEQLAGRLSRRIDSVRDGLVHVLAHVEAHIDFPDEDISPATHEQLLLRLRENLAAVDELLRTAEEGQILRRGVRAAIVGRPNAGKSSLLNQLLGHDRAIVSPIPGTTRDTIEEMANIRGIPVVFIDTAGLRETGDEIETEGVRRSEAALAKAELVLHVLDAAEPLAEDDRRRLLEWSARKHILVCNKADLPRRLKLPDDLKQRPAVETSCATGQGFDALKDAIQNLVWSGHVQADAAHVTINSRHQEALKRARSALDQTIQALSAGHSLDLVALDLRIAVNAVGEIVGKTTTEDILDSIFSQFCIGK